VSQVPDYVRRRLQLLAVNGMISGSPEVDSSGFWVFFYRGRCRQRRTEMCMPDMSGAEGWVQKLAAHGRWTNHKPGRVGFSILSKLRPDLPYA
jgi:hypothetical protein